MAINKYFLEVNTAYFAWERKSFFFFVSKGKIVFLPPGSGLKLKLFLANYGAGNVLIRLGYLASFRVGDNKF
ncbi:MAG: hypothetical protein B5M54_01575 [Candidatus Aminicenantes bacterium 4484_214]|nr:MAG: hypothetical protein B5M54_01575 [Candidatus Aminicenantes bacterium 4484_214]